MTLELQSIGFNAETKDLLRVIEVMDQIGDSAEKNSKRVSTSFADIKKATNALTTEKVDIGLDDNAVNKAKAYVEQLDKVVAAVTKMPKGVSNPVAPSGPTGGSGESDQAGSAKKSVDAVEKLVLANKILRGEYVNLGKGLTSMGDGFSKSQASQMASLILMGKSTEEVLKAKSAIEDFNKMSGVNPFDKSTSGAYRLAKQVEELNLVQKLQAENTNLTRKEIVDYSRDLERVSQMEKQGAISATEAAARRKELGEVYKTNSTILRKSEADANAYEAASKASGSAEMRKAKELAAAQTYVTSTLEKLNYQVSLVEEGMGKGASSAAFRFEQSLKKLGLSASEQTRLLNQFEAAQAKLTEKQTRDKMDYVSRAVAPQITDIVVGLSTGQSPMTVMLQQGGQLRDMFGQMGIASQDMSNVMRTSMVQMAGSVKGTLLGMFGLVQGIFLDMGKAAGGSIGKLSMGLLTTTVGFTLGEAAAKTFQTRMANISTESSLAARILNGLGATFAGVFAVGIAVAATTLIALGLAFKSAFDQQDKLEKALHTTGASLGFNVSQAYAFADGLKGISQSNAVDVMIEMAKQGGFTREQVSIATKSIYEFSKVSGQSLEDVVKGFKSLEKDPVEALYNLNSAMGLIPTAAIAQVSALSEAGKASEALILATKLLDQSQTEAVSNIKREWGTLYTLFVDMKGMFDSVADALKKASAPIPTGNLLATAKARLAELKAASPDAKAGGFDAKRIDEAQTRVHVLRLRQIQEEAEATSRAQSSASSKYLKLGAAALKQNNEAAESEKDKTRSLAEFKIRMYKKAYGVEFENMMASVDGRAQAAKLDEGILTQYNKLQEQKNRSNSATSRGTGKDLKTEFDAQYQILDKELQAQLDLNKKYHEAGIINDKQYFEKQNTLLVQHNTEKMKAIEAFRKKASTAGPKNKGLLTQLDKQEELLGIDAIKQYGSQIAEATKGMKAFFDNIEKVRLENALLAESIKGQQTLTISMIGESPDQQARMQAEYDMREKTKKQLAELTIEYTKAEKAYQASQSDQSAGFLDPAVSVKSQSDLNATFTQAEGVYNKAAKALADYKNEASDLVKTVGDAASIQKHIDKFKELSDTVNSINLGQTLASGFDTASNSIAGLVHVMGSLIKVQEDYDATRAKAVKDGKDITKIDKQHGKNMVKTFGDMAGAAKGYFAEHTAGYKVLNAFEGIFKAMQIAEAAYTVVSTAGSAARAVGAGIEALAVSLTGAPPPISFGMFAATAAILAGIGVAVGGGLGGGGGGSFAATNTGTGTVKGDPTAQSESISKSIEELNNVDTMTMKYSAKMLVALNQIENNTSGLADLLVSSGMIKTNASSAGVNVGFKKDALGNLVGGKLGGTVIGAIGGALIGPIGMALGGVLSSTIGKALGGLFGTKTSIQGQGFNIGAQGLGTILQGGLSAQYYTDVEKKKKSFGFTTSTSRYTNYSEADKLFKDQISLVFSGFADSVKAAAPLLGTSLQTVTDKLNGFIVNIGRVETSGLSQEDLQKRLSAVFSALGDNLAGSILPGFEKFQKVGEGYFQTIVRVASGIEEARNLLDNFGITMVGVQTVMNKQGAVSTELVRDSILAVESLTGIKDIMSAISGSASELAEAYTALIDIKDSLVAIGISASATTSSLIGGAGGLDNLQDSISSYMENFMTEAERLAAKTTSLRTKFQKLGLTMPTTAEGFVALVKGIDTSSESGQKLLGKVLGLSSGFSEITTTINDAAKATLEFVNSIIDYVNKLDSSSSNVISNFAQAKALFGEQINLVKGGDSSAKGNITSYADKLLEAARNQASSAVEYQTILASVKSELLGLTTGVYSNTVLTSDNTVLQSSNGVNTATQIASQSETTQELLKGILNKLTQMQTEDRSEGQSSIVKLSTIEKIFKRIDNDDSIRVTTV